MRQSHPVSNDENMAPGAEIKRKRDPDARPDRPLPADSSDDDWQGVPFEAPKKAARKDSVGAPAAALAQVPHVVDWPAPAFQPAAAPSIHGAKPGRPPWPADSSDDDDDQMGALPSSRSPAASRAAPAAAKAGPSKASAGKGKASAKKATPRPVALRPLPGTEPVCDIFQGEAAAALITTWQFVRCFAHMLQPEEWVAPSLEQLRDGLCSTGEFGLVRPALHAHQPSVGTPCACTRPVALSRRSAHTGSRPRLPQVGELHMCLLKRLLKHDSSAILDDNQPDEEAEASATARVPTGVAAKKSQVPRPNTGLHAWLARDFGAYVDEVSWPEVLRQAVVQWHLRVDEDGEGRSASRVELDEPEPALMELARRLQREDFSAVLDPSLKCRALGHLAERAIELFSADICAACDRLDAARKDKDKKDRTAKKNEREAQIEARRRSAELWAAFCLAEEALDRASQAYHKASLTQKGVPKVKAALQAAQAARDEARAASRLAKDAVKQLQAMSVVAPGVEGRVTERLQSKRAIQELQAAAVAEAKRAALAALEAARREQWQEMVRVQPLGKDADGAFYWHLPRPSPSNDLEQSQPRESGSVVMVEHADGRWGRLASVGSLTEALAERGLKQEAKLLERLGDVASDDDERPIGLGTPAGKAASGKATAGEATAGEAAGGTATTPGGTSVHEWVGVRVRRVFKSECFNGVVTSWRPARGDGKPAVWYLRYDDGDEEGVCEDEARAALYEAAEAQLRQLRRKLLAAELALLGEPEALKKVGKAGKEAPTTNSASDRARWAAAVQCASDAPRLKELLIELHAIATRPAGAHSEPMDPDWEEAWTRELESYWCERVGSSQTLAQLSMRADELQWNVLSDGGISAGTELEVRTETQKEGGSFRWRSALVAAVFPGGSFRVVWEERDGRYQTMDLASARSRSGRKEQGAMWRFKVGESSESEDCSKGRPASRAARSNGAKAQSYSELTEDESGESTAAGPAGGRRGVAVGDLVEAIHGAKNASGHARKWVQVKVSRLSRGNFEAAFCDEQYLSEPPLKLSAADENKRWRWLGDD